MKTILLQLKPINLLFFAVLAFSFTACDNDDNVTPPIKDELVGTWDITSYNLGGDEYMGFIMEAASLEFEAYTGEEGTFTEEVTFPGEQPISISGPYTVDEEDNKVFMTFDGDMVIAKVEIIDGDSLVWDGNQDGFPLKLEAVRR